MRIRGDQDEVLRDVWLSLTRAEALDLRTELNYLLGDDVEADWHAHVLCEDGLTELTIDRQEDRERSGPQLSPGVT